LQNDPVKSEKKVKTSPKKDKEKGKKTAVKKVENKKSKVKPLPKKK